MYDAKLVTCHVCPTRLALAVEKGEKVDKALLSYLLEEADWSYAVDEGCGMADLPDYVFCPEHKEVELV